MRRKSGSDPFFIDKDPNQNQNRNKSSNLKKHKSRGKAEIINAVYRTKIKSKKSKELNKKVENKSESYNSTTLATIKKSKSIKVIKKIKCQDQKSDEFEFQAMQIMNLINFYANKIQKQWRVHLMRTKFKQIIRNNRQKQKLLELVKFEQKFTKIHNQNISKESQQQIANSKGQKLQKFFGYNTLEYQGKKTLKPNILSNCDLKSNLSNQFNDQQSRRISLDLKQKSIQNRRHSSGQHQFVLKQKQQKMRFDKVLNILIQKNDPEASAKKIVNSIATLDKNHSSKHLNGQDQYDIKFPLDKMVKKCRRAIQTKKLKKLLSIENRYNKQQITPHSYQTILNKINEEHKNQIQNLNIKEGLMRSNWEEIFIIYKSSIKYRSKFLEDSKYLEKDLSANISMSFQKWDFNSSAKKSLENNFQDHFDMQNENKASIISVLKQLDDFESQTVDKNSFCKKFKSMQTIQTVADKSKQTSQKDINQKKQVKIITQKSDFDLIKIDVKQKQNDEQSNVAKIKAQINIAESKQLSSSKPIDCQSLMVSKIQGGDGSENFNELSLMNSDEKQKMKDFLLRDFNQQFSEEILSPMKQNEKITKTLHKFIQLVEQKLILYNIKIINSFKFIFAKVAEDRVLNKKSKQKRQRIQLFIPIETDIDAINTWLLQISHFCLDNYQTVLHDNLTNIKQPPFRQLISYAKKNQQFTSKYQAIPEYIFKDFQFYYIKTLAKKNNISPQKIDNYSTLIYTFHRALIDSINIVLLDQLATGKRWLELPWRNQFKRIKKIQAEETKQCLQKTINIVSNWAEYNMGRMNFQQDFSDLQYRQYQQEKINLVSKQEALQVPLASNFTQSFILIEISNKIFEQQIDQLVHFISKQEIY